MDARFDQTVFPTVMEAVALDVREKLGPNAHRPD